MVLLVASRGSNAKRIERSGSQKLACMARQNVSTSHSPVGFFKDFPAAVCCALWGFGGLPQSAPWPAGAQVQDPNWSRPDGSHALVLRDRACEQVPGRLQIMGTCSCGATCADQWRRRAHWLLILVFSEPNVKKCARSYEDGAPPHTMRFGFGWRDTTLAAFVMMRDLGSTVHAPERSAFKWLSTFMALQAASRAAHGICD